MTAEDRCPVVHFDHNSAEHAADPVASYRALRNEDPVAYTEAHGGYWVLTGYQAVFEAARDDDVFSSARSSDGGEGLTVTIPKTPMHHHIPIEIDPPDFRKYRKILNAITSPAAIVELIPRIEHHTTWFIDRIIEQGHCDFGDIIGVPAIVTVEWLGLPIEEWSRYSFQHRMVLAAPKGSPDYVTAILASAVVGDDSTLMLTGPIPATHRALARCALTIDQMDAIEVNEAFAPVPLAWLAEFPVDPAKLNPRGSAIALGHPLGASGARLMTTMLHHLEQTGGRYGLQTMCEAGGMANATVVELI
jgi:thiolase-like protein